MTRIKICGLTNLEDALVAAEAGADLIGFVFFPRSPRYIEPERAGEIVTALRQRALQPGDAALRFVGVFVNESPERVRAIAAAARFDAAQLHGDETPEEYALALPPLPSQVGERKDAGLTLLKALRPRDAGEAKVLLARYRAAASGRAPAFLVDAFDAQRFGGTGARADWGIAARIAREFPILLAGGLTADNVADAIRAVRPWGVDVSSGVERAPGIKDYEQIRRFVRAVKSIRESGE